MRQEFTLHDDRRAGSEPHESQGDMAELSSHLALMAVVVGLIIAWVCFCGV